MNTTPADASATLGASTSARILLNTQPEYAVSSMGRVKKTNNIHESAQESNLMN